MRPKSIKKIDDRLISLNDFSLCRNDRTRQRGGVALYVRNTGRFKPREDLPNKSLELICIVSDRCKTWLNADNFKLAKTRDKLKNSSCKKQLKIVGGILQANS